MPRQKLTSEQKQASIAAAWTAWEDAIAAAWDKAVEAVAAAAIRKDAKEATEAAWYSYVEASVAARAIREDAIGAAMKKRRT
jgi:hypothetical protein